MWYERCLYVYAIRFYKNYHWTYLIHVSHCCILKIGIRESNDTDEWKSFVPENGVYIAMNEWKKNVNFSDAKRLMIYTLLNRIFNLVLYFIVHCEYCKRETKKNYFCFLAIKQKKFNTKSSSIHRNLANFMIFSASLFYWSQEFKVKVVLASVSFSLSL